MEGHEGGRGGWGPGDNRYLAGITGLRWGEGGRGGWGPGERFLAGIRW